MTSSILIGGEFVPDRGYDRGQMIVHTEEEWRRRAREHVRRSSVRAMWRLYPVLMLFPAGYYVLVIVNPADLVSALPALVCGAAITATWVLMTVVLLYVRGRPPVIGLYERGFQHNVMEFLPYDEIREVDRRDPSAIRIVLPSGKVMEWGPWWRLVAVLGEDGVEELTRRVRGPGWTE